jgi:hypothetical protein
LSPEEAREFLTDVAFVAFPGVKEWLRTTDRPEETFTLWTKAMKSLKWDDCQAVIDRWLSGQIKPPTYLRDSFVAELAACVPAVRKRTEPEVERVPESERYRPTQDPLYLTYWGPLKKAVDNKELSIESARIQWHAIIGLNQKHHHGGATHGQASPQNSPAA